jgi:hypothetical protein
MICVVGNNRTTGGEWFTGSDPAAFWRTLNLSLIILIDICIHSLDLFKLISLRLLKLLYRACLVLIVNILHYQIWKPASSELPLSIQTGVSQRSAIRSAKRHAPLTKQASISASRYCQVQLFASFLRLCASVAVSVLRDALSRPLRLSTYQRVWRMS